MLRPSILSSATYATGASPRPAPLRTRSSNARSSSSLYALSRLSIGAMFATVEHMAPMLSLDNAYNDEELRAFDERVRKGAGLGDAPVAYVAELKIDGLSIALTYEDGRLIRGATRGDGVRGEVVTHNVRTIRTIPLAINAGPGLMEVRGEVYLSRASFERMNKQQEEAGEPLFANPRNAAAGTMRNLEPSLVAKRGLGAFTYQVVSDKELENVKPAHSATLKAMRGWGLPVE